MYIYMYNIYMKNTRKQSHEFIKKWMNFQKINKIAKYNNNNVAKQN